MLCTRSALIAAGKDLADALDQHLASFLSIEKELENDGQALSPENLLQRQTDRIQAVASQFAEAVKELHAHLKSCGLPSALDTQFRFRLALTLRVCQPFGSHPCSGRDFEMYLGPPCVSDSNNPMRTDVSRRRA